MQTKKSEIWVGAFMLIALCAIVFICLQVANLKSIGSEPTYRIYATFDNIGGLKPRSPVKIGGVVIGRVADIELDPKTYTPRVAWISRKVRPNPGYQLAGDPHLRPAGRAISGA